MGHLISGQFWIHNLNLLSVVMSLPGLDDGPAWACWALDRVLGYSIRRHGPLTRCWELAGFGWRFILGLSGHRIESWGVGVLAFRQFLGNSSSPDSIHRISTNNKGREGAFGMGTRRAERTVENWIIWLFTISNPILAVFDLARPLQLGTGAAVVEDEPDADTAIGVAVASAWESCCYDTKAGKGHRIWASWLQPGQLWLCQDQMDLLGGSIVASAIDSYCYSQGDGRTGLVWVAWSQLGTAAATVHVHGSSRPNRSFCIKIKNSQKLKTLKTLHSTHTSTWQNSVGPATRRVWSARWVFAHVAFFSLNVSFLIAHQNRKTKTPVFAILRFSNPHLADSLEQLSAWSRPETRSSHLQKTAFIFVILTVIGFWSFTAYSYICIS